MHSINTKNVIISFLPLGWGGAGDHVFQLTEEQSPDLILIPRILFKNRKLNKIFAILQIIFIYAAAHLILRCYRCNVIINHPQTLGYGFAAFLVEKCHTLDYHVVDTHFFCIKSYNEHDGRNCTNCLEGIQRYSSCMHFPRRQSSHTYDMFQKMITKHSDKISFFCQTQIYKALLIKRYGDKINVSVKKMHTKELRHMVTSGKNLRQTKNDSNQRLTYDFGLHGAFISPKGSEYLAALAKKLPAQRFIVPEAGSSKQDNVQFIPATWKTGLRDLLSECRIVLCPSVWSAPVEGAVIKSMLDGHPTAILHQNTFASEIPDDAIIKLTGDADLDYEELLDLLSRPKKLAEIGYNGAIFAKKYMEV